MLIRPVTQKDHPAMMMLAEKAGYGMTSLPQDAEVLQHKIAASEASFAGKPAREDDYRFLMVMEDEETGQIVGSTGVKTHVGLVDPFYSYKLSMIVQASRQPQVYARNRVLHMVNDYTGASEIGSLFLLEDYRRNDNGKCLSRCRFLFIAEFATLFDERVIAEMRGVHDVNGSSPFYDSIAKHFFKMPFDQADYTNATQGGQFIADLMPKYPIYEKMLPKTAQEVIGVVNEASRPALKLLEREGFRNAGYVDIFDGGPTVEAPRDRIRTVVESQRVTVTEMVKAPLEDQPKFILMTTRLSDVRITHSRARLDGKGGIILHAADAKRLRAAEGNELRVVEL